MLVEDKVSTSLIFDYGKIWENAGSQDCRDIVVEVVRSVMRRQAQSRSVPSRAAHDHHSRIVYKFEPHAIVYYEMLSQAFPATPWVFLYRDPVETLWSFMSVLHHVMNPSGIYCVRNQRSAHVSRPAFSCKFFFRFGDWTALNRGPFVCMAIESRPVTSQHIGSANRTWLSTWMTTNSACCCVTTFRRKTFALCTWKCCSCRR